MSDLTKRDPAFRAWVETFPDEHWAKKDLSACRLGWDAAKQRCIDVGLKVISNSRHCDFCGGDDLISKSEVAEEFKKALEKQE